MQKIIYLAIIFSCCFWQPINALPAVNLGSSNILDGGPTRPNPGWYWSQTGRYYTTQTFTDFCGNNVAPCLPAFNSVSTTTQFIYQSTKKLRNKIVWGADITLPIMLYSRIDANTLSLQSAGSGFGDLVLGTFLQWDPIMYKDRPLFVQRVEINVSVPTGKNRLPDIVVNPGSDCFFLDPLLGCYLVSEQNMGILMALSLLVVLRKQKNWHCSKGKQSILITALNTNLRKAFGAQFADTFYDKLLTANCAETPYQDYVNVFLPLAPELFVSFPTNGFYLDTSTLNLWHATDRKALAATLKYLNIFNNLLPVAAIKNADY